jgi:hypothetical protein
MRVVLPVGTVERFDDANRVLVQTEVAVAFEAPLIAVRFDEAALQLGGRGVPRRC